MDDPEIMDAKFSIQDIHVGLVYLWIVQIMCTLAFNFALCCQESNQAHADLAVSKERERQLVVQLENAVAKLGSSEKQVSSILVNSEYLKHYHWSWSLGTSLFTSLFTASCQKVRPDMVKGRSSSRQAI